MKPEKIPLPHVDVIAKNEGTVWAFIPQSPRAKQFIDENVQTESWQWLGKNLVVDHRYAEGLIQLLEEEGGLLVFQF